MESLGWLGYTSAAKAQNWKASAAGAYDNNILMFKVEYESKISKARTGSLITSHGKLETPCFLPDATRGLVKLTGTEDLQRSGVEAMVVNTFHLYLQPGTDIIRRFKGTHSFMNWKGPLVSDSGGFQVFSLIHQNPRMGRITDEQAIFRSPSDGSEHVLTPEKSIAVQFELGTDIMVCLDDCPPNNCSNETAERSVRRTVEWAKRCKDEYDRQVAKRRIDKASRPFFIAVIQGGVDPELRRRCAEGLLGIGFDGYGYGARPIDREGVFLGDILAFTSSLIPASSLRFALGVGLPEDILRCVAVGWDLFDCVIPTREGRHGKLFFSDPRALKTGLLGRGGKHRQSYKTLSITRSAYAKDRSPISPESEIPDLRDYSKAFLHHLFKIKDPFGAKLASLNNLEFYQSLMRRIKSEIRTGRL